MSREIKFRAWTNWDKPEMLYSYSTEWLRHKTALPLMQFTGLYDKNGKDIYESDIISDGQNIGKIIWGDYGWLTEFDQETTDPENIDRWGEVIGNIYEHSHLLNNGK